jgi:ribosome biogenesis GTPase
MQDDLTSGLVVRVTGREIWVDVDGTLIPCLLRGRFRRRGRGFALAAGDRVGIQPPGTGAEAGTIEAVEERDCLLARYSERDGTERPIVANVERLFIVAALKTPPLRLEFIDRVLVAGEHGGVGAVVVANKIDLAEEPGGGQVEELESIYRSCGYQVLRTSAATGEGVDALSQAVGSGIYAFVGESGVGKSSLLMRIDPGLDLKVKEVGDRTGRGRHTTTFSQLYPFRDGYLADTPGVQTFDFPGEDPGELRDCFPEFAEHADCKFHPCSHSHEPGCGVKEAVERGEVASSRHQSYLHLLDEVTERARRRSR